MKLCMLTKRLYCRSIGCYVFALDRKYMSLPRNIPHVRNQTPVPLATSVLSFSSHARNIPERDIEVQVDDIWSEIYSQNRLPFADIRSCREIIKYLLSLHYHRNHIIRKLCENTVLLKFPVHRWKETVENLQTYGFQEYQFLPVLAGCHDLLHGSAWNNLQEILMLLHSLEIPKRHRLQIVASNPKVISSENIQNCMLRYSNLLKVFTKNEAQTLVAKNPTLFTDSVAETNKKINYMYNEMGIRQKEITESQVFEYPLSHLITRHQFAERAGVYKLPDKHEIAAKERKLRTVVASANPSLSDLVDTSNLSFASSFCSMSVAEYKAFSEMMNEELQEDDTDSDSSDSDSE